MSSIFPLREKVSLEKREPRLVDLDEETANQVFEALSAETTRSIFLELHDNPQTTSDIAETTDTSVQNAQYHIKKLVEADLVEVVDTWYSERGSEMKVYAPKDEALVLFAGRNKQHSFRQLLDRVVGVAGILVPSSALVGLAARWRDSPAAGIDTSGGPTTDDEGDDAAMAVGDTADGADRQPDMTAEAEPDDGEMVTEDFDEADDGLDAADAPEEDTEVEPEVDSIDVDPDGVEAMPLDESINGTAEVADTAMGIDPLLASILFFFGGLFVFAAVTFWYGPGIR